jgi:hypothetical protein
MGIVREQHRARLIVSYPSCKLTSFLDHDEGERTCTRLGIAALGVKSVNTREERDSDLWGAIEARRVRLIE